MMKPAPPAPDQLGPAIAYLALKDGTPVYDREGSRVGVVEHVMAVGGIFEGIIIHTYPLPGRHLYADAGQIAELRERGVLCRWTPRGCTIRVVNGAALAGWAGGQPRGTGTPRLGLDRRPRLTLHRCRTRLGRATLDPAREVLGNPLLDDPRALDSVGSARG